MLLLLTLLAFVSVCSSNRYEAAEAIHHAIFGDTDASFEDLTTVTDEATVDAGESADAQVMKEIAVADWAVNPTTSSSLFQRLETSSNFRRPAHGEGPDRSTISAYPMAYQHAIMGTRHTQYAYHGGGGSRTSGTNRALSHATTTSPTNGQPGQPQNQRGQSYSFLQLSAMSASGAPGHRGNFYRPESRDYLPEIPPCQAIKCHLSIAIIMDSSGSVGEDDYRKELSFVKTLLEILFVKAVDSKLHVCTGIVSYSTDVHVEVDPCCENSICRIVDQFRAGRMQYRAGSTNTNGALKVARQMLQATASHKKVALLITDGKSNTGGSPVPFAKQMRNQDGIQIVALGVTRDVNRKELMGVSGMSKVTKIDVFDDFHELASILLQANKVPSHYELETTFNAMCDLDRSYYKKDYCVRTMTEEQKKQCVWNDWSNCVRKGGRCSKVRTCMLNGIVILREDEACPCPPCEPGKYLNTANQHCVLCPANTYSNQETTVCLACPADKFSRPGSSSIGNCVNEFDIVDSNGNVISGEEKGLLLYKGGTVCDDYFDVNAAIAICKLMGRPHDNVHYESGSYFSFQSSLPITMDDVRCDGSSWEKCTFIDSHNCRHSEDIHVACRGVPATNPTAPPTFKTSPTSIFYNRGGTAARSVKWFY
ncbi:hypothetical protein ACHWQZ_G019298 [Mnemiopsis leidyi]